jgi:hypothetical protein
MYPHWDDLPLQDTALQAAALNELRANVDTVLAQANLAARGSAQNAILTPLGALFNRVGE